MVVDEVPSFSVLTYSTIPFLENKTVFFAQFEFGVGVGGVGGRSLLILL